MRKSPASAHLAILLSCALTAACSGGGGGGTAAAPAASNPAVVVTNLGKPDATVSAPQGSSLRGNSPLIASGSTPNFTSSPPPNGTVFPLNDTVVKVSFGNNQTATTAGGYTNSLTGGTTLTFQGTQVVNGVTQNVYQLKEPGLSIDASNLVSGVQATLSDGRRLSVVTSPLNYTLMGLWIVSGTSNPDNVYWGIGITGYQTPTSGVPASGTATYTGNSSTAPSSGLVSATTGGVYGLVFAPTGSTMNTAELRGQASLNVNFSAGTITGSLTNMTSSVLDGGPDPWNSVSLSGTLSGATVQGSTAVTSVPAALPSTAILANSLPLGAGATGSFSGAFFGPNAQELGINWTLYDPSGNGKMAIGSVSAIAQ